MNHFFRAVNELLRHYPKEQIFLRSSKSMGHAYKEIEVSESEARVEVMEYFFGLFGAQSPLPDYILEKFTKNEDDGDGFSLLFDFFNNHLLWLLYESATLKNHPRSFSPNLDDRISRTLLNILGFHDVNLAKNYLHFSPLIVSLRKPKSYVEKVLQYNFNLPNKISILENIPQHIDIHQREQNALGRANHSLGKNFILGKNTFCFQNRICLLLRDIPYYEALNYLPNQPKHNKLKESIIFLTNNELSVMLKLHITYHAKMQFILGDSSCAKLGFGKILGAKKIPSPKSSMQMLLCL